MKMMVGAHQHDRLGAYDFHLPEDLIALRPAARREDARMLHVRPAQGLADRHVRDLPMLLRAGDVLVLNDTRVIPAQLFATRSGGQRPDRAVSLTLHARIGPATWRAFARPGRKLRAGDHLHMPVPGGELGAHIVEKTDTDVIIAFDRAGGALDEAIEAAGVMPLPPYIARRRAADERDRADYQTCYAERPGAVAAPTAGLHFTPDLLARLAQAGIGAAFVTLHVGAGTFAPLREDDISRNELHSEWGEVSEATARRLQEARAAGGRIVCVGTTSLRILEAAAQVSGELRPFAGETRIFIQPGHRFLACDLLMTNFHLPRSSLFMLVAAFSGLDVMQAAYAHAIAARYRFYSYGDACLLQPAAPAGP